MKSKNPEVWRHTPSGWYYVAFWVGGQQVAAGPMVRDEAQSIESGAEPLPRWYECPDWPDMRARDAFERVEGAP